MPRDLCKFVAPDLVDSRCTECGAQVPAEFTSCDELFMSILTPLGLRGMESPDAAALGRLIVDTLPTEPDCRGALTIRYVYDAETEAELAARVHEWAKAVWEAYSSQHEIARQWVRKATGE